MSVGESRGAPGVPASRLVVAGVLAAGAGSRYGKPKILAHQGEWLRTAVAAVREGGCDEVCVAMGAAVVPVPRGASALVVADWADGVGATVGAVVRHAASRAGVCGVVLHVVDTPDVGADVVARVLGIAAGRPQALVRAVFDGAPGHPVYLGADHFDAVLDVLDGDIGAAAYLRGRGDVITVECGDLASGRDVDVDVTD